VDLRALLAGLTSAAVPQVPEVTGVCCDSQRIRPGDVFVAIPGFREDGRCHIAEAKARGAVCVLSREPVQELPWAAVQDPRRALAEVSARLYRHPDRELAVVGVTGTNGKTTTTYLVRHILRQTLGVRVGLIGTIRNLIDETKLETERTTPESCDVYRLLRQMADAGCRYGVMEVSSHALALERVRGITFRVGAFTNLTRDHLDFHRTMEDYCDAKAQLFRQCEAAVCNGDDPWTPRLLRECACPVLRYGTGDSSRLRGENLRLTARSVAFDALLDGRRIPVTVPIPGRFTVYNALAALGICHMLGVPPEQGAAALQTASGIKGRMEVVPTPGLPCTVLIDYAHTPDALENVLTAVRGFAEGRVVAVFGCGGDRDREKRPQMGRIVSRLADVAVVTSDNPRWEQPEKIIEDILPGLTGRHGNDSLTLRIAGIGRHGNGYRPLRFGVSYPRCIALDAPLGRVSPDAHGHRPAVVGKERKLRIIHLDEVLLSRPLRVGTASQNRGRYNCGQHDGYIFFHNRLVKIKN